MAADRRTPHAGVDLYWIPLGAGGSVPIVRWSGRLYEALAARRDGREACDLFHAALQVFLNGERFTLEMAPAWGASHGGPGVVATGPVGFHVLGRSRFFRYEVRRWREGVIPDLDYAVDGPRRVSSDPASSRAVLDSTLTFPTEIWGRHAFGTTDMWNSNSLIAWALFSAGLDAPRLGPPNNGRAPGWSAGLVAASRREPPP